MEWRMAKNRKPRKKYRPRWVHRPLPPEQAQSIREKFIAVQVAMEMKLHLGTCTTEDIDAAVEMFNIAGLSLTHRKFELEDDVVDTFNAGAEALASLRKRALTLTPVRYVCTAKERDAILNGLETVGQYLVDEATDDASRLLIEWKASLIYGDIDERTRRKKEAEQSLCAADDSAPLLRELGVPT